MDEPGSHDAKGTMTGTKRKKLHDLTHMWNLKKLNIQKHGVEKRSPEVGSWGK